MWDEKVSRDNFFIETLPGGLFGVKARLLPGLLGPRSPGPVLMRIPAEVAPTREAAEAMLPWIADGLRNAYEAGRAGGIAEHQRMFRELIGGASEQDIEDLREAVDNKVDRD